LLYNLCVIMNDSPNQARSSNINSKRVRVAVHLADFTENLSCPLPNMVLWNMHPKVYLAFDADNQAICPYCSTHYVVAHD